MLNMNIRNIALLQPLKHPIRALQEGVLSLLRIPQTVCLRLPSLPTVKFRVCNKDELGFVRHFESVDTSEWQLYEAWCALLRHDDTVYDIGANVGLYAVTAAKLVPQGQVYAFEPLPALQAKLKKHCTLNTVTNCTVVPLAICDRVTEAHLHTNDHPAMLTASLLPKPALHTRTVRVRCETLDHLQQTNTLPPPDVMKIDVEGAEHTVLNGGRALIRSANAPRMIAIEIHTNDLPPGVTPESIYTILTKTGYVSTHMFRSTCDTTDARFHALFVKTPSNV